jgi:putative ABC transport system permease protein
MRHWRYFSDLAGAAQSLREQKIRTLLTGLGIVFGVGAVIGMLSIGAGARQESLRFIEELGVRNLLVQARAAASEQEYQQRRKTSPE